MGRPNFSSALISSYLVARSSLRFPFPAGIVKQGKQKIEPDRRSWKYVCSKGFFSGASERETCFRSRVDGGGGGYWGNCAFQNGLNLK